MGSVGCCDEEQLVNDMSNQLLKGQKTIIKIAKRNGVGIVMANDKLDALFQIASNIQQGLHQRVHWSHAFAASVLSGLMIWVMIWVRC